MLVPRVHTSNRSQNYIGNWECRDASLGLPMQLFFRMVIAEPKGTALEGLASSLCWKTHRLLSGAALGTPAGIWEFTAIRGSASHAPRRTLRDPTQDQRTIEVPCKLLLQLRVPVQFLSMCIGILVV